MPESSIEDCTKDGLMHVLFLGCVKVSSDSMHQTSVAGVVQSETPVNVDVWRIGPKVPQGHDRTLSAMENIR